MSCGNKRLCARPYYKRLSAYLEGLAEAAGHSDRHAPLKSYCTGLLLPGERKSVEPMTARLAPDNVRRMHQSLHHLVADAPWSDRILVDKVRRLALPAMEKQSPVVAWVVDDTGLPKKGIHSVGVIRQYRGQVGKQDNCRIAVSLSAATSNASLPIAYQLYLPEAWTEDQERRRKTGVPEEIGFQTKPQIALAQIRQVVESAVPPAVVLADAAYGNDGQFRAGLAELELQYAVGSQSSLTVWAPGTSPLPAKEWNGQGRPPKLLRRDSQHQPVCVKQLAASLPASAWKTITWREGKKRPPRSRFAAFRVRPAHRDYWRAEPHAEEWLLMEWSEGAAELAKYWLSTLPATIKLKDIVRMAKHRWIIERDYEELKQELGLGHDEGRGWRGFHHHGALCIAAYGFLVMEKGRFPPSARSGQLAIPKAESAPNFQPRGRPAKLRTA